MQPRGRALLAVTAAIAGAAWLGQGPALAVAGSCRPWTAKTFASGLGVLENLSFDHRGSILISAWQSMAVERVSPDGKISTVISGVRGPGGMVVVGRTLWLNTGNNPESGVAGLTDGKVEQVDLDSRSRKTWASGLTMPNGLVLLPGGGAVVSRDIGSPQGLTRIDDPAHPQANWVQIDSSNGLVVDRAHRLLYVDGASGGESAIFRVPLDDPSQVSVIGRLGSDLGLDDMTSDRHGVLYMAANSGGKVLTFDRASGRSCTIASGQMFPSSVRFGSGAGWNPDHLYVTSFDGTIRELTPPAGVRPNWGS
jgi:hypothetical protein